MSSNTESTPVWFITGCSTGLGRALAERVLQRGHRAVVTARNPAQIKDIVAQYANTSLALALDVTNSGQVEKTIAQAEKTFARIDVLVNNAGYSYSAAIEEGEEEEVRAMFETNFFGLVALIKRVLPGMRARGRGHIINISSVAGLIGNPGSGYYNATKFAVEGLSEALSKEVGPLGIHVTTIEPGPSRTDFARSRKRTRNPIDAYAKTAGARFAEQTRTRGKQAGDPVRIADAIIKVVEFPTPPLNLVLGKSGLDLVRAKLDNLVSSIDQWEAVTVSVDFPQG